jgi:excisionase family DNA binding protein
MNLLSTQQAAERLGVDDSRVRRLIQQGRLPAMRVGRAHLIREEDLALVAVRKPGRPPKMATDTAPTPQAVKKSAAKAPAGSGAKKAKRKGGA